MIRFWLLLLTSTIGILACGEGSFDQRVRGDINALRANAFFGVNSNPVGGEGRVVGAVSTGGPVTDARVVLYPVDKDGQILRGDSNALGNGITSLAQSGFGATVGRTYQGPIIVAVLPHQLDGKPTTYGNPATASTQPLVDLDADEELLGYVLDFPYSQNAVIVSPLTTLVVERALYLGGISSGNLSVASKQVGEFFGLFETREKVPGNLIIAHTEPAAPLEENLALAAISQIARDARVAPARVWQALRADIRDDGELNGSFDLIPGSGYLLPNLGAVGVIGTQLLANGYLAADNSENLSAITVADAQTQIDLLDGARSFAATTLAVDYYSIERGSLALAAGETATLGVRAFGLIDGRYYLVASSDGPSLATVIAISNDLKVCAIDSAGRIVAAVDGPAGMTAEVSVRMIPDGTVLTGPEVGDFTITVRIVE